MYLKSVIEVNFVLKDGENRSVIFVINGDIHTVIATHINDSNPTTGVYDYLKDMLDPELSEKVDYISKIEHKDNVIYITKEEHIPKRVEAPRYINISEGGEPDYIFGCWTRQYFCMSCDTVSRVEFCRKCGKIIMPSIVARQYKRCYFKLWFLTIPYKRFVGYVTNFEYNEFIKNKGKQK